MQKQGLLEQGHEGRCWPVARNQTLSLWEDDVIPPTIDCYFLRTGLLKSLQSEFQRLRLAYDLYGFVKLTNSLEPWQVDSLEDGFDRIYIAQTGLNPNEKSIHPLPPINKDCETDFDFMKTFASAAHVLDAVHAIAGCDVQFLAADILCVYDDSIGPHRDALYEFDTPKVLVFLSDCHGEAITVPQNHIYRDFSGSFAVLSGSHLPGSLYNSLACQLTDWPDPSKSVRVDLTPNFLRGDEKPNGDVFYPYFDYDTRYQGYCLIPFKRGDVVIFSPRALHALLPTYSQHFSKLAAFLFLEGFSKATGAPLNNIGLENLTDQELGYISLPHNLSLNDQVMKGADFDNALVDSDCSLGLSEQITKGDKLFNYVFEPMTQIYRICESDRVKFQRQRRRTLSDFAKINDRQNEMLDKYYCLLNDEGWLRLHLKAKDPDLDEAISSFKEYSLTKSLRPKLDSKLLRIADHKESLFALLKKVVRRSLQFKE